MYRRFLGMFAVVSLAFQFGCGRAPVAVHPVHGTLMMDGTPVAGANIAFHALNNPGPDSILPVGRTARDGSFDMMSRKAYDGAPAGEYAATISWPDFSIPYDECAQEAHDRFNGRYADPRKSGLSVTVVPGRNEILLRTTVGANGWSLPRERDRESAQ